MFLLTRALVRVLPTSRSLHTVPALKLGEVFAKSGIEGLYTPQGFRTAWSDYQRFLTTNLTLRTNGSENELRTPYQIVLQTAKNTTEQHTFHYASQAHNNHLFFEQLAPKPEAARTRPLRFLMERLADQDFANIEAFREEFLAIADSSFGQGWLFLVELADKSVKIVRCNNDGTPYYYGKNQLLDLNGGIDEASFDYLNELKDLAARRERDFALPLLALNLWDVAYIEDYGVTGKADYLNNVWDCINWEVVNKRLFLV